MATQITNYQCPACTGPLHFAAGSGKLECEYCGNAFEPAEIEAMYAEKEAKAAEAMAQADAKAEAKAGAAAEITGENPWDTSDLSNDWGADAKGMRTYSCPSCGAELICEATTAATSCPYCGNPTVVPGQFSGALRPDYVIPFKLAKPDAVNILKKHYKGKVFLPKTFLEQNTIEKVQGVYVPFWLYDGQVSGSFIYQGTQVRVYTRGDVEITETNHYNIYRSGELAFEKVPVDASSKMPDDYMDTIEPFDYGELKKFSTAYLPGFLADKYDVTVEQSHERADLRCTNTMESVVRETVTGYSSCVNISKKISLKRGKVHYALLPVWLLNVKWKDEIYLFAINGQTGKLAGNLPISYQKVFTMFGTIAGVLGFLGTLLAFAITR